MHVPLPVRPGYSLVRERVVDPLAGVVLLGLIWPDADSRVRLIVSCEPIEHDGACGGGFLVVRDPKGRVENKIGIPLGERSTIVVGGLRRTTKWTPVARWEPPELAPNALPRDLVPWRLALWILKPDGEE